MDDSARRPSFSVEEVPTPGMAPAAPPPPQTPVIDTPVVETIPSFTTESTPAMTPPVSPALTSMPTPVEPTPTPPNIMPPAHKTGGHPVRKLFFLLPAVVLVATIFLVARFSGNNFISREPAPVATVAPTVVPATPVPTPTPAPVKLYKNEDMLIQMNIPESYEVLSETADLVSMGRGSTELFTISTELTEAEEGAVETMVGGKKAIKFGNFVQTTEEPLLEFGLYPETPEDEAAQTRMLDSVIFLVDTSDWETFDNITFNYKVKYPGEWEVTSPTDKNGVHGVKSEISKDPADKSFNNLVIQTSTGVENAALTASEIVSSTRTLSGWKASPQIKLEKLGGGDAQVIQGELTGKWRAYVVIWYKNTVVQMTWDDAVTKGEQQTFDNILATFEFTS